MHVCHVDFVDFYRTTNSQHLTLREEIDMSSTPGCHGSSRRNADLYRPGFPDEGSEGRFGRLFAVGDGG